MFYEGDRIIWEMGDHREYLLSGGPFDGQTRFHTPDVATEEMGFDEPYPFEAAKWQADPERKTKTAKYRWNKELMMFEYKGDGETQISGWSMQRELKNELHSRDEYQ